MNRITLFIAALMLLLASCNPRIITNISYPSDPLSDDDEIKVLALSDGYPDDYAEIGIVEVMDPGFSNDCKYDRVVAMAKKEAREAGGNVIKIFSHLEPSNDSFCDQIKALILKVDNVEEMNLVDNYGIGEVDISDEYATLYIYRRPSSSGALIGYPLSYGDSVLCYVSNGLKKKVRLYDVSADIISARTEVKKEIPVVFEKGNEYFIRCGVEVGFFVGHPKIEMVKPYKARREYYSFNSEKGFKDVVYLNDGDFFSGEILEETQQKIYMEIDDKGKPVFKIILRKDVKQIIYAN